MRSKTSNWTGLPGMVVVLGFLASATVAQAVPVVNYSTSGTIDSVGITGTPVISFNSVLNSSFGAPSSFSLGDYQVAALPDGQTTTYNDTAFHITYLVNSLGDGTKPDPNETPLRVSGVLNGSITGGNQSHVIATFDPITNANFVTGPYSNVLSITDNPLTLVPSTTNSGRTSAQAFIESTPLQTEPPSPSNIPEPTSIAFFLTTLAGLGVHHARRRRSAA